MSVKGLLLINLGSPRSTSTSDVREYLQQFLTDRHVIDLPTPLRYALVYGLIAPLRAAKSAGAYRKVWTENGSPLLHFTRSFAHKVKEKIGPDWDVRWAMRYGEPSLAQALSQWNVSKIYIVPLYPQYAESSTRSAVEEALRQAQHQETHVLNDFFAEPEFIEAQAAQIGKFISGFQPDHVLLSYHGLPQHHLTKLHPQYCTFSEACCHTVSEKNRHCYRAQAFGTSTALRARLLLPPTKISVSFQSRLGRRPWIKPYTDHVVSQLAARGVKRLLVSCPSFVADCLETLEEVEIRLRDQFLAEGGEALQLVPALNDGAAWVDGFCAMIKRTQFEPRTAVTRSATAAGKRR